MKNLATFTLLLISDLKIFLNDFVSSKSERWAIDILDGPL